jgi:hypothetical protein
MLATEDMTMLTTLQTMKPGRSIELDNGDGKWSGALYGDMVSSIGFYGDNGEFDWTAESAEQANAKLAKWGYTVLARG